MKIKPGRRQRRVSKKSASLTVEFLERRVVLNADPTGGVLITGSPFEGQELAASNTLVDTDGLGPIAYQWKSDSDPIPDATSPTYVLQDSDVSQVITVVATYTDLLGTEEVVSSQPTAAVGSRLSLRDVIIDDGSSITDINLQAGYLHSDDGIIYVSIDSSMSAELQEWWLEVFADADSLIEPEFAIVSKSSPLSQLTVYQLQSDYTSEGGSGVYIGPSALIYQDGTVERTSEARIELGQSVYSHSIRFAESLEAGWKSVAYHELGHAMGLEHPHEWGDGDGNTIIDSNTTVMSYEQAVDADGSPGYTWLDVQALTYVHGPETGAVGVPVEGTLLAELGPFNTAQTWKTPSLSMAFEGGGTVNESVAGTVTKRLALTRSDGYLGNGATVFLDWGFGPELYWTPQTENPEWYRDIMFGGSYPSQVVFQPDQQVAYVDITVFGDERIEGDEWLEVTARESRSPGYFQAFPAETLRLVLTENAAPTSVVLSSTSIVLDENTPTTSRQKLADIQVTDDESGINSVSLSGPDAAAFEVVGTELFLKAGVSLNVNVQSSYAVTINVSDNSLVGSSPVTTQFTLTINRPPAASYSPEYTTINGRNFGYYVPESYDPSTPTPLLFMFHGLGGNSSEQSGGSAENSYYGWQTTAHENGFIVLFPESLGFLKTWDLGGGGSSSDLSFIDNMIGWASTNYNISESQIFTTGHSWGAYFSYYVATYRSDDIAAFGAHSGGLGGAPFLGTTPSVPTGPSPTPALNGIVLHAIDDGIVSYSNSQNLYDGLLANGHNVYDDGIGNDGIIEVNGWGPDNHRYRLQHNQTQWDFFLSVAPDPVTSNQPPRFNTPIDLILNEDAPLQSIALTGISSGDGVVQPVRVSATSSNPGLIPDPMVSYSNSSDAGSLVIAPVANRYGAATITVTVEDGGLDNNLETAADNAIVSETFEVAVTSVNDSGSFTGNTSVTGSEDDSTITGTLVFTDAIDGDSVPNYTITSGSSNGAASIDATTGAWSYTPGNNFNGSDSFSVTVTDDDGYTETQVISLTVEAVNDAPTLDVLSGVSANEDDGEQTVNLTGITAGDGETQPLSITAVSDNTGLISDPTVTYSSPGSTGTLAFTPVPNQNGTATITVTVVDGGFDNDLTTPDDNGTTSRTVSVAVAPVNDAPTLDALSNVMLNEGDPEQTVNLIGMSTGGGETQLLSVTAVSDSAGLIPDPVVDFDGQSSTGILKFTPGADQHGTATITVTIEDGGLDNVLETTGDNAIVSQAFEVAVLEMLSYEGSLPLSQNAAGDLYVDKEPVFMGAENAQANIRGFQVLGADDAGTQKSLVVRRDNQQGNPVRCRVLTDDVWRISSMFDSLTNETHQSMDSSARDVVYEFPAAVLPGTTIGNLPYQYETSGLTWHDGLQKLFSVSDEGIVSMMNADGTDIVNWDVPGDLEALTVADHTSDLIYIGVENPDSILEFDVSTGQVTRTFDLTNWMTGADNRGLEALAFVPDTTHPEGGLFYAGLQSDGRIYQFALPIVSSSSSTGVTFVQSMAIEGGSTDLAGLAYDPSSELLLAMFDSIDQLNVIDRDGQLRSRWNVPGVGQEAVVLFDGQFYVGDDSLFSITLYAGFDLLVA